MTPEAQRIAIAEACGWVHPVDLRENGITQDGSQWWTKGDNKLTRNLPDYLNDLNAMHEAEKVLKPNDNLIYLNFLAEATGWRGDEISPEGYTCHTIELFRFATATASQRAEAFLRTLGLWKD